LDARLCAPACFYWRFTGSTKVPILTLAVFSVPLDLQAAAVDARLRPPGCCLTSTKVQILTQPGDVFVPIRTFVLLDAALLVQKYKY
jgi:hypothetical protein